MLLFRCQSKTKKRPTPKEVLVDFLLKYPAGVLRLRPPFWLCRDEGACLEVLTWGDKHRLVYGALYEEATLRVRQAVVRLHRLSSHTRPHIFHKPRVARPFHLVIEGVSDWKTLEDEIVSSPDSLETIQSLRKTGRTPGAARYASTAKAHHPSKKRGSRVTPKSQSAK